MRNRNKALVEGYRKEKEGSVVFRDEADIVFANISEKAKELIKENWELEYKENDEAYIIDIDDTITVYADTERARLYAKAYLLGQSNGRLAKAVVYNYPAVPHRSVRVYLPAKKDMPYFKRFINMLVYLGYNTILLEVGGAMEYKRHPEINETWAAYCQSMKEYNDKPYVAGKGYYRTKNSIHTYNGEGDIYTQNEMRELVAYCNERCIEVIPEVPSLSHSEYILLSHPELKECEDEPYAATACPSNPGLYTLVNELYDEVIEVFQPRIIHIGHDEWWVMCVCDKCKNRKAAELYTENVMQSYNYLKKRGIQTMMWADKLMRIGGKNGEMHGGSEKHLYNVKTDQTIDIMGKTYPLYRRYWFNAPEEVKATGFHQVIHDVGDCADMLPDDIWYMNWYWLYEPRVIDDFLLRGRKMVYANCTCSCFPNSKERFAAGAAGISVSNWLSSTEAGAQRWNTLYDLGYGAALCWGHTRKEWMHEQNNRDVFKDLYQFRNRETLQSSYIEVEHTVLKNWKAGEQYYDNLPYADEEKMTLGEYVVTYSDGSKEAFPVLYSLNIGTKEAITERYESPLEWCYRVDKHLTTVASVCDVEKKADGVWYRTVFPIKDKVIACEYIPREGLEEYVGVERIIIINK